MKSATFLAVNTVAWKGHISTIHSLHVYNTSCANCRRDGCFVDVTAYSRHVSQN